MNKKIETKRKKNNIRIICLTCIILSMLNIAFTTTSLIIINSRLRKVENVMEYYGFIYDEPKEKENQSISEEIVESKVEENDIEISDNNSSDLEYVSEKINDIVFEYPNKGTVGEKGYFDEYGLEYYLEIEELTVLTKKEVNYTDLSSSINTYYLSFKGTNFYDSSPSISIESYDKHGISHDNGVVYLNTPCGEYTEVTGLIRDLHFNDINKLKITIKP